MPPLVQSVSELQVEKVRGCPSSSIEIFISVVPGLPSRYIPTEFSSLFGMLGMMFDRNLMASLAKGMASLFLRNTPYVCAVHHIHL